MKRRFNINILFKLLGMILLVLVHTGCIKNDLPYPRIQQNITAISVDGEIKPALIDSTDLAVTLYLGESVDIEKVRFNKFEVSEGGEADPDLLVGSYDLSSSMVVKITRYQTYEWIVRAEQNIERYFNIEGQIGETIIDLTAHRILVDVPESFDLSKLTVTGIKLGPAGLTSLSPEIAPGVYDFSKPFKVISTCFGRSEEWTIYVEKTEEVVSTVGVDPWSQVIWAYGTCQEGLTGGFRYRKSGEVNWTAVPKENVTQTGGSFSCFIPHLTPLTSYEVQAVSGTDSGASVTVTTQATADIPDGDFNQWWLNGKIWCPWNEGGERYWDTGNTGAATLGQSNVVPSDYTPDGSGKSAELNTRFVGIGMIGKLAAGSIYTGSFKKVDGTNGILDFGRPWNLRPTKLKGYYQYKTAPINYANSEWGDLKGRPDSCHIYVALTDWTAPFEIRTNPNNRHLFDKNADYVIGYGELIFGGTMEKYQEFEIKINYKTTSKVPSYIQITAAASKYGDYFTGGAGAVLYVDQFSFSYDY